MVLNLVNSNLSLAEAIANATDYDTIELDNKVYFEKITLAKKHLTLIGKENTVICYNVSHGDINPETNEKYGTTGSATFRVLAEAISFKAINITFKNTFDRTNKKDGQAVAFKAECDVYLENCKFIGAQDTLYLDYAKNDIVKNCYIEGDVDFIFGSANALFENCNICCISKYSKECYITAPNTLKSNLKGLVFSNCSFSAPDDVTAYLGRPWYPPIFKEESYPKLTINKSKFHGNFIYEFKTMHENDPVRHTLILNDNIIG